MEIKSLHFTNSPHSPGSPEWGTRRFRGMAMGTTFKKENSRCHSCDGSPDFDRASVTPRDVQIRYEVRTTDDDSVLDEKAESKTW